MLRIAIEMLLGERVKYLVLISALACSTFLMTQQIGIYCGVMQLTAGLIRNTNVPIWIVSSHVEQVAVVKPMAEVALAQVRSLSGIEWAEPLYYSLSQASLDSGKFFTIQLIGVDGNTLLGLPPHIVKGKARDLQEPKALFVDEIGLSNLSEGRKKRLQIGDTLTINDHEMRIAGVLSAEPSFFSYPLIYTTYERAIEIAPFPRHQIGYILAKPAKGVAIDTLLKEIDKKTNFRAFSAEELSQSTMSWVGKHVGIPISFAVTSFLGFSVGLAIAGQTFYAFINENLSSLRALKAMGISHSLLQKMLFAQAALAGAIGYGIGLFFSILFACLLIFAYQILPFYIPFYIPFHLDWQILLFSFLFIVIIVLFTASIAIRKVKRLKASDVFYA